MKLTSSYGMTHAMTIVESSPLRRADPRTKLALCLCASLAVMLPLEKIIFFASVYVLFLIWARLLPEAARQAWKLKWILGVLFLVDWLVI
ncbi:MAG TPA: CbiQ family ECF transporter T component, partial [Spirochaetota bacterium]|nr:CbiQ family ECF transporter T component [Spirochaetota bacterium]HQJ73236.1 CbiQ family ECF transporter T component [Spirochaetota bacterium]HRS79570.1 CbiQ family ECF transporter T component [Spirochaetota bacterium]